MYSKHVNKGISLRSLAVFKQVERAKNKPQSREKLGRETTEASPLVFSASLLRARDPRGFVARFHQTEKKNRTAKLCRLQGYRTDDISYRSSFNQSVHPSINQPLLKTRYIVIKMISLRAVRMFLLLLEESKSE